MAKDKKEQLPLFEGMMDEESKDLAVVEDEESAPLDIYTNQPTFSIEDVAPPMLKLLQGLSPEVQDGLGTPGQWVLSGFDPKDDLIVVPVSFARRREYRDPDTFALLCKSFDGETGQGEPGGDCASCPMNKWNDGKPPKCQFMYSYVMYVSDFQAGGIVNFKRTGLAAGKALNSIMSRRGFGNVAVVLGSKKQTGKKGSYFIPQLRPVDAEEEAAILNEASLFFSPPKN